MNTLKESKWMTLLVLCTLLISFTAVSYAQDEVSTKIVGFVKAPMGEGFYYYSVPFKNIGDDEQIIFLNADYDNDGVLDGFSDGTFSDQNFSTGDKIYKFNSSAGAFDAPVEFKTVGTKTGWYEAIAFPPFARLASTAFEAGEGFLVKYANAPSEGGETYMLGEVNDEAIEIPIAQGFNLIGNPYPSNLLMSVAFALDADDPDNDAINPAATSGVLPFAEPITGDIIITGFNPETSSWSNRAVFWDNPATPEKDPKWCYSVAFPPFYQEINDADIWTLEPGKAYLYKAYNGFIWKVESPVADE